MRGGPTGSGTCWTASGGTTRVADVCVRNDFGEDDSVVDLAAPAEPVPPTARRVRAKKETMKETASAQTAEKTAAPAATRAGKTAE
jgi:hypothetical protein